MEYLLAAVLAAPLILALLLAARPRSGVITAERDPVNPPAPARLVPLGRDRA